MADALAQEKFDFHKKIVEMQLQRKYDLEYVKLTVIIVLLIVIIFYITCKFNAKTAEKYTEPQLGLTKNDQKRSDADFDIVW
jgi:hypothetical protein